MKTADFSITSRPSQRRQARPGNTSPSPRFLIPAAIGSPAISGPIGLGFRVPMLIISPFTRGGFVSSDLFDHTSILRFLETRFGAEVPNLSAWRRATVGDLTSAFNFKAPEYVDSQSSFAGSGDFASAYRMRGKSGRYRTSRRFQIRRLLQRKKRGRHPAQRYLLI